MPGPGRQRGRQAVLVEQQVWEILRLRDQAAVVVAEYLARVDPTVLSDPFDRQHSNSVIPSQSNGAPEQRNQVNVVFPQVPILAPTLLHEVVDLKTRERGPEPAQPAVGVEPAGATRKQSARGEIGMVKKVGAPLAAPDGWGPRSPRSGAGIWPGYRGCGSAGTSRDNITRLPGASSGRFTPTRVGRR